MTVLGDANGVLWRFGLLVDLCLDYDIMGRNGGSLVFYHVMVGIFVSCPKKCPFCPLCVEVLKRDI